MPYFLHSILGPEFRVCGHRRQPGFAQSSDFTPAPYAWPCKDRSIANKACVVLISTRNPLNIGAAARAMANFGLDDLRAVNPYEVAFREAVSAVGGAHVLQTARVFETVADAVADCSLVLGTT